MKNTLKALVGVLILSAAFFAPLPSKAVEDIHPNRTWECWFNEVEVDCYSYDNTCICVIVTPSK